MPDVETATSDYDRERLRERLAKLASGVAIIRVGGATETDATVVGGGHRSATCATTLAGSGRVHFSGALYGPFLASACKAMNAFAFASLSETHGIHELQRPAPTSASASASFGAPWSSRSATSRFNAGVDGSIVVGKLVDQQDIDYGFDAQSLQYADLVDAGIVDPTKVVRLALQDAASIAGLLITIEVMVAGRPEDNPNLLFNDSASAARLPTPRHDGEVSLQHAVGTWRSNWVFALRGTDTRRGRTAAHAGGRVNAGSSTAVGPSSS